MTSSSSALRPLTLSDALAVQQLHRLPEAHHAAEEHPRHPLLATRTEAEEWIAHVLELEQARPWRRITRVTVTAGELIGLASLDRLSPQRAALNCLLNPRAWHERLAVRAVRTLLAQAFTEGQILRIDAQHHPDNTRLGRVLHAAGFRRTGRTASTVRYFHHRTWWQAAANRWTQLRSG